MILYAWFLLRTCRGLTIAYEKLLPKSLYTPNHNGIQYKSHTKIALEKEVCIAIIQELHHYSFDLARGVKSNNTGVPLSNMGS